MFLVLNAGSRVILKPTGLVFDSVYTYHAFDHHRGCMVFQDHSRTERWPDHLLSGVSCRNNPSLNPEGPDTYCGDYHHGVPLFRRHSHILNVNSSRRHQKTIRETSSISVERNCNVHHSYCYGDLLFPVLLGS